MGLASSRSGWLSAAGAESSSAGDASARRKEQDDPVALSGQPPTAPDPGPKRPRGVSPVDLAVGASALGFGLASAATRGVRSVLGPAARLALRPPGVPRQLHAAHLLASLERVGAGGRASLERELSRRLDTLVPLILAEVLRRARLTDMVLTYVDLDTIVAEVDLDAAAARLSVDDVARRLDIEAVQDRLDLTAIVLERVVLDALVMVGLDRVDIDAVARRLDIEAVVERLDLTAIVLERVDLDALVKVVLDRVDINGVARRVDVEAVLDRLDLTAVVLQRVDLDALVKTVLARIDIADIVGLAEEVIDAVDLPEIIRESTGSMASDTVRGARMQGIVADEAVGRAVDRLLLRHGRRHTEALGPGMSDSQPPGTPPPERGRTH